MCKPKQDSHRSDSPNRRKPVALPEDCERGHSELVPLGANAAESLRRLLIGVNQMQLRRRFPSWQPPNNPESSLG